MFSIFKKKITTDSQDIKLDWLETDWHCHVLPGIDDGAATPDDTLTMLEKYVALGIKKIIATPHIRADFYRNTKESIAAAHQVAIELIKRHQLPLTLDYSAEYYADENFMQLIANNDLLPIENQYILFELPMNYAPLFGLDLVAQIQKAGFVPVLAHPERYRFWHGKAQEIHQWKRSGVYFQLNLLSLVGHYGSAERRAAEQLLDADYIDVVGTDAHSIRHLNSLQALQNTKYWSQLQQLPLLNQT